MFDFPLNTSNGLALEAGTATFLTTHTLKIKARICFPKLGFVNDVTEHFDVFEAQCEYISIEKRLRKEASKRGFEKICDPSERLVIPSRVDLADGEDFDEEKTGVGI